MHTASHILQDGINNPKNHSTGDSGSWTIRIRLRPADGLLVSTGISADAGTVLAACSILRSILRTTGSIYEQHEDARTGGCGFLAAGASDRRTPDSERAPATGSAADHGNIYHATSVPYAMKSITIDRRQLIVTYDTIAAGGLSRKSFRHIPTPTHLYILKFLGDTYISV